MSASSNDDQDRKLKKVAKEDVVREELQEIVGDIMRQDVSAMDVLLNNAKAIGGVLGAEHAYMQKRKTGKEKLEEEYFLTQRQMELMNLTFKEIERTHLGRQIKN